LENNLDVRSGDDYKHIFDFENVEEAIFSSPILNYQVPLYKEDNKWVLFLTSYQTQIIEIGNYPYEIRVRLTDGQIKTFYNGIINIYPSIFPIYKSYPVVIREINPTEEDYNYGVPTIWYNRINRTSWILEYNDRKKALWYKTSDLNYIYQFTVAEETIFLGDTTRFSFIQATSDSPESEVIFIKGTYNKVADRTTYLLDKSTMLSSEFFLYADKSLEDRQEPVYRREILPDNTIYKYVGTSGPTKLSQLENDKKFMTKSEIEESYQKKMTGGEGISIIDGVISINYPNGDELSYGE
jgi:hypothetical protein